MKKSELRKLIKEELLKEETNIKIPSTTKDGEDLIFSARSGDEGFMVAQKYGGKVDRVYIEWEQLKKIMKYK